MNLPRISIVTPSYNQADFLEQTICSVLDQEGRGTIFDLEYFVIDGGSTDASSEIIRKYESELSGWCSERDRGQTHAINKGMDRCSGDIIAYINSDDYYLPGAFKRVVEAAKEDPKGELIHGICQKVDAQGSLLTEQLSSIRQLSQILDLWEVWLRRSNNQNFIQPEVFWTRRLAEKVGSFNERLHYTMDFDFWVRALDHQAKLITIEQPLAAFRIHVAQKTSQRDKSILELIEVTRPYLQKTDDGRISASDRRRLIALNDLNQRMIENQSQTSLRRLKLLSKIVVAHPYLATSSHYWRYVRRTFKTIAKRSETSHP